MLLIQRSSGTDTLSANRLSLLHRIAFRHHGCPGVFVEAIAHAVGDSLPAVVIADAHRGHILTLVPVGLFDQAQRKRSPAFRRGFDRWWPRYARGAAAVLTSHRRGYRIPWCLRGCKTLYCCSDSQPERSLCPYPRNLCCSARRQDCPLLACCFLSSALARVTSTENAPRSPKFLPVPSRL